MYEYRHFIHFVKTGLVIKPKESESQKTAWIVSHFQEDVIAWYEEYGEALKKDHKTFLEAFEKRFTPMDMKAKPFTDLVNLRHTATAAQYIYDFNRVLRDVFPEIQQSKRAVCS